MVNFRTILAWHFPILLAKKRTSEVRVCIYCTYQNIVRNTIKIININHELGGLKLLTDVEAYRTLSSKSRLDILKLFLQKYTECRANSKETQSSTNNSQARAPFSLIPRP